MTGKTNNARVAAATAILDRAFGRPSQTLRAQIEKPNVQYFISDKPFTVEEWEAKHCTGN
jgi:hypothetical protein